MGSSSGRSARDEAPSNGRATVEQSTAPWNPVPRRIAACCGTPDALMPCCIFAHAAPAEVHGDGRFRAVEKADNALESRDSREIAAR